MKASGADIVLKYRRHSQLIRSINLVLRPLIPDDVWQQLRVSHIQGSCLYILLDHSVMLMQMRGMQQLLLRAVQMVHSKISVIQFNVTPKARAYLTPDQDYSAQKRQAIKQSLSNSACRQLESLYVRCKSPVLKKRLGMILARYSSVTE
tara:strand:- start:1664 stop:2110 length:447 start_codon:yes stop_codon:yes gene_type:complete